MSDAEDVIHDATELADKAHALLLDMIESEEVEDGANACELLRTLGLLRHRLKGT